MLLAEPLPLRQTEEGVLFVGSTRITLDTVVGTYLDGCTPETIVSKYLTLPTFTRR